LIRRWDLFSYGCGLIYECATSIWGWEDADKFPDTGAEPQDPHCEEPEFDPLVLKQIEESRPDEEALSEPPKGEAP